MLIRLGLHQKARSCILSKKLTTAVRPPVPPFTLEKAIEKVRLAENAWNSQDANKVALAYSEDCWWRNRSQFITGRQEIIDFLTTKWKKEIDYKLIKELWSYTDNRIAVKFQYEYRNSTNHWFRAYGNENWEFNASGLMTRREASINDVHINKSERQFLWKNEGARPLDYPGLKELGF